MARRFSAPYQSEPVSSLATWSRNLAIFAVIAAAVSILIVRFGFLEMKPALATFSGALALALFFHPGRPRRLCRDLAERVARHGPDPAPFLINAILLAYPAYLALQYRNCRRFTTSPPIRSIRRASRRWLGCAAAKAPTPRCLPDSIRPNSSGPPIPISRPWSSKFRRSGL